MSCALLVIMLAAVCAGSEPAPAPRAADDRAAKLVEQLGAAEFKAREAAQRELRQFGEKAEAALRAGLRSESPEIRQRAAKVLAEIRKDTHAALVKVFDPAKEDWPDHPLWRRFERIAGDTAASRDVFARVIENFRWYCTLDDAERNPATAATAYREEMINIGRRDIDDARNRYPIWEYIEGGAYIVFLGSYPATRHAPPDGSDSDRELYDNGEHRFTSAGLECGLRGEQPSFAESENGPKPPKLREAVPGTDRVFGRLLATWLPNRTDRDTLREVLSMAHDDCAINGSAVSLLPFARRIAADKSQPVEVGCMALFIVARYGTRADLPLFERFFENNEVYTSFDPEGRKDVTPARPTESRFDDMAIGLALLLCDQFPHEFGFENAPKENENKDGPPIFAQHHSIYFGFSDKTLRPAAHAKARAFLAKQEKKDEPRKEEPRKKEPDKNVLLLIAELGAPEFKDREEAQREIFKYGWYKAEAALREGLKSENPEIVKRCNELLVALQKDLLGGKESPVWVKFKAVAGDDDEAWKLYKTMIGNLKRGGMLLAAVEDPKKAAASYATEWDEIARRVKNQDGSLEKAHSDFATMLFLGILPREGRAGVPDESVEVMGHAPVYSKILLGEWKKAVGKLYAAWVEPRPAMWEDGLLRALLVENPPPPLAGVARKVLAAKDNPPKFTPFDRRLLALRFLGLYGSADDLPLVMKFTDIATEFDRFEFSKYPDGEVRGGGGAGTSRPRVENTDVVVQVRDVAMIAALQLHKQKPSDFGFEMDVLLDRGRWAPAMLTPLGFCRDADREAAHKKAREWLGKKP